MGENFGKDERHHCAVYLCLAIQLPDEIYVTAGEKGREDEDSSPRERGLKKRDVETSRETNHQC
ncbi:hypothetical protein JCM18237_30870 [Halorubrum luteum]